ncbi:MAG: hypothetical protein WC829_15305 [Hyphomicrobium sp.]|jgi:hypothetical protein
MKTTINGFVHLRTSSWSEPNDYVLTRIKFENNNDYLFVAEGVMTFTIPAGFDPRAHEVEVLKAEKIKLMADFQNRVTEIERKISELTCLEAA